MKKNILEVVANIINICLIAVLILVIILGVLIFIINQNKIVNILGYKTLIITSGSMEPSLYQGDIILLKENKEKIDNGDVITYDTRHGLVTHRVVDIVEGSNEKCYITKGDNNQAKDTEIVGESRVEGVVNGKISFIRNVFLVITNKFFIISIVAFYIIYIMYGIVEKKKKK